MGQVDGLTVEKHIVDKPQRIGHSENPRHQRADRQDPLPARQLLQVQRLREEHLLGQKTVEQRHPCHGGGSDHGQGACDWHVAPQPIDAAHVAAAGLVVDDAGRHEQRGLENGVVDHVEDRTHCGHLGVETEEHGNQAEMADGRVRQQSLEVMLKQRYHGAEQHRHQSESRHHHEPQIGS